MISLLINSYTNIFLIIGLILISLLMLGVVFIIRRVKLQARAECDMTAIAGDDVFTTQLDLAKALIEINNNKSAKKILKMVKRQGNIAQKTEAKQLLSQC